MIFTTDKQGELTMNILSIYLLTVSVSFGIDMLGPGVVVKDFQRSNPGHILRMDISGVAVLFFYLLNNVPFFALSGTCNNEGVPWK
jgi:hypothetical protein